MKEGNKYAIQGYLFLGGLTYFIFFGISNYFNIFQDLLKWTTLGLFAIALISSTGYALSLLVKNVFESIELDRNSNKRNILYQYFVIVPQKLLILIIMVIPFLFTTATFYIVGFQTLFYKSVCQPILGGILGDVIWYNLFFLLFCYLNYQIYKPISRFFDKYF